VKNIAEIFVDFFVENMRENAVVITTRPLALLYEVAIFTGKLPLKSRWEQPKNDINDLINQL